MLLFENQRLKKKNLKEIQRFKKIQNLTEQKNFHTDWTLFKKI